MDVRYDCSGARGHRVDALMECESTKRPDEEKGRREKKTN